jgi:hypothetical protein
MLDEIPKTVKILASSWQRYDPCNAVQKHLTSVIIPVVPVRCHTVDGDVHKLARKLQGVIVGHVE